MRIAAAVICLVQAVFTIGLAVVFLWDLFAPSWDSRLMDHTPPPPPRRGPPKCEPEVENPPRPELLLRSSRRRRRRLCCGGRHIPAFYVRRSGLRFGNVYPVILHYRAKPPQDNLSEIHPDGRIYISLNRIPPSFRRRSRQETARRMHSGSPIGSFAPDNEIPGH